MTYTSQTEDESAPSPSILSTMATPGDTKLQLSAEKLKSADKLTVVNENGENIEFGSLYQDTKAMIIFIRV